MVTYCLKLQHVYGKLEVELQLDKEVKLVTIRDRARKAILDRGDYVAGVMYAGNARYGTRRPTVIR